MKTTLSVKFNDLSRIHNPIKKQFLEEVGNILDSGGFITGKNVVEFENQFANYCNSKFALGTGNGYDALKIAIRACELPANAEIIVPAHTFIATWYAVSNCGYKIIPIDADPITYNISVKAIENAITPNAKAIIPVHLYGQSCQMDKIMDIAKKYNLYVIEDNAQAQGATYAGKITGSFGHINATSFYPGKNLGAGGDAGAVVTSDENIFKRAKMLRNYGSLKKYEHQILGENSRMDEIQAALLKLKLTQLTTWNTERQQIASYYNEKLNGISGLILPKLALEATSVYHLYVVRTNKRNELQHFLAENGIETIIHYPIPPHLQKAYAYLGYKKGDFPNTESISETCLTLPIFPKITNEELEYVVEKVKEFFRSN